MLLYQDCLLNTRESWFPEQHHPCSAGNPHWTWPQLEGLRAPLEQCPRRCLWGPRFGFATTFFSSLMCLLVENLELSGFNSDYFGCEQGWVSLLEAQFDNFCTSLGGYQRNYAWAKHQWCQGRRKSQPRTPYPAQTQLPAPGKGESHKAVCLCLCHVPSVKPSSEQWLQARIACFWLLVILTVFS